MNRPVAISLPRALGVAESARRIPAAWVQLALVLTPLLVVPFFRLVDPDFWWHLETGELIAGSGFVRQDPFSWTAAGEHWVAHEWLSEVLIYTVQAAFGYWANALLFGAVAAAASVTAYAAGRDAGAGSRALVMFTALAVVILGTYATVRPQAFSWLLFAVFFFVIQRSYDGDRAPVWALPPLMLLWSNLHLGFFFGFGLLGAWCLALGWELLRGRAANLRRALLVTAACVAASVVHPEGPALLLYPLRYLNDAGATHAHVAEWQAPNYINPFHWPIFLGAAVLAIAIIVGRPRAFHVLVSLGVLVLAMQAVRNAPFLALLLPAVAAPCAARAWSAASRASDSDVRVPASAAIALVGATLFATSAVMLSWNSNPSLAQPDDRNFPAEGAAFVAERYRGARVFNEYGWGGYLLSEWHPHTPVGIDGRTDFYGDARMSSYYRIFLTEPGWEEELTGLNPEIIFVSRDSRLAKQLRGDPAWIEELTAEREAVFVRRDIAQRADDGQ